MKFKLSIQMGNVAMMSRRDIARKLQEIATELKVVRPSQFRMSTRTNQIILDDNGNSVGEWEFVSDEE